MLSLLGWFLKCRQVVQVSLSCKLWSGPCSASGLRHTSHTGWMKSSAYQNRWALSSGCCNAQNIADKVRNAVMVFARTSPQSKWTCFHSSCSRRGGRVALSVYHSSSTQDKGRRNCLCSLSLAPFLPGQTCQDRIPAFLYSSPFPCLLGLSWGSFSQPANSLLHLYPAQLELFSAGSLEMWPSYEATCTFLFLTL